MPFNVVLGLIKLIYLALKIADKPWSQSLPMEIRLQFPKAGKCLIDGRQKVAGGKLKGQCGMYRLMICLVNQPECRWMWRTCWFMEW